jgi:hypothetical protein
VWRGASNCHLDDFLQFLVNKLTGTCWVCVDVAGWDAGALVPDDFVLGIGTKAVVALSNSLDGRQLLHMPSMYHAYTGVQDI